VEVVRGQNPGEPAFDPVVLRGSLAARAVAVAAGVVEGMLVAALVADPQVAAERSGPAGGDGAQLLPLGGCEGVVAVVRLGVATEDVRHPERRAGDLRARPPPRRPAERER
jgi:hypothetical protein